MWIDFKKVSKGLSCTAYKFRDAQTKGNFWSTEGIIGYRIIPIPVVHLFYVRHNCKKTQYITSSQNVILHTDFLYLIFLFCTMSNICKIN